MSGWPGARSLSVSHYVCVHLEVCKLGVSGKASVCGITMNRQRTQYSHLRRSRSVSQVHYVHAVDCFLVRVICQEWGCISDFCVHVINIPDRSDFREENNIFP